MSRTVRVLVADDSAVIRRLLTEVLQSDPEVQVVHAAKNGVEAVDRFSQMRPDCVVLDVEMPVMDGLEAVRHLRRLDKTTPILMFSALTSRGAQTSLEALSRGATDVAVKPSSVGHLGDAIAFVRRELVPKIKLLGTREILRRLARPAASPNATPPPVPTGIRPAPTPAKTVNPTGNPFAFPWPGKQRTAELVAIGSSTGGPNALADVIREISPRISAPILIVQHMPPLFTQLLADRLNGTTSLTVREATDGALVQTGDVWIAPGNFHMTLARQGVDLVLKLNQDPPVNSCRPSVDVLFASVAEVMGSRALGVVLTGMGRDGRDGAAAMKATGARIFAQDEESCVVYGMPRAIVEANLADAVLPLEAIPREINSSCRELSVSLKT